MHLPFLASGRLVRPTQFSARGRCSGDPQPILEGIVEPQPTELHEHRNLPEADVAEAGLLTTRKVVQHRTLAGRKPGIAQHPPDPDVRVEEWRLRHRKTSIWDSSTTLANGSPVNAPRTPRASSRPPRLGYHGPDTPLPQRLWEVQLPTQTASAQGNAAGPEGDR